MITKSKLNFNEFTQLWRNIRQWCAVFKRHDSDGNNIISAHELRASFQEVGLNVNRQILEVLIHRFGVFPAKKDSKEKGLSFEDFIQASMKLKHSIDTWNSKSKTAQTPTPSKILPFASGKYAANNAIQSKPSFTLEEFVERMMYC
ncbi:unnamed protein product [Oppiella nova]|uniref:EF-hand domain-containing protein n=1 Tax=Oppiella nova TaxID=334625 RepID=A0A7R9QAG4_9ACAR|nr:unnamed protein product [Oppiella nova]CAG2159090.1 unnamed protein product [Oppiella nova]